MNYQRLAVKLANSRVHVVTWLRWLAIQFGPSLRLWAKLQWPCDKNLVGPFDFYKKEWTSLTTFGDKVNRGGG